MVIRARKMRLIRTVGRPAMLCQFQVNKSWSGTSLRHPVLVEASNGVHGSNILSRGRSSAASASSDAMEARKPRRRVSKKERKLMVENYVNKYRETNAGKFPTVSVAMKDVGGSYYSVRQILQELIYNSKQSSLDTKETFSEKSAIEKDEISTNIGAVSQTRELREVIRPILKEDIGNSGPKIFKSKQRQQSSISVELSLFCKTDKSEDVGTQSHHLIDRPVHGQHADHETNIKQEKFENKLKVDRLEPKAGQQESTEISYPQCRELHKVPSGDAEPQKKSSVWNNLKSFANEIFSMWKR